MRDLRKNEKDAKESIIKNNKNIKQASCVIESYNTQRKRDTKTMHIIECEQESYEEGATNMNL